MKLVTRWLSISAAILLLMLGGLGVVLPGLPTTPFVLLAAALLLRSSPRLHQRLLNSRLFGPFLTDWQRHRAIRRRTRRWALCVVFATLALTLSLSALPSLARILVGCCGAIGIGVILRLPVIEKEQEKSGLRHNDQPASPPNGPSQPRF